MLLIAHHHRRYYHWTHHICRTISILKVAFKVLLTTDASWTWWCRWWCSSPLSLLHNHCSWLLFMLPIILWAFQATFDLIWFELIYLMGRNIKMYLIYVVFSILVSKTGGNFLLIHIEIAFLNWVKIAITFWLFSS